MRKFVAIFYGLLFSLFFIDFCCASVDSPIKFELDGDGKNAKIILPVSISLLGQEIQSAGSSLFDLYHEIGKQNEGNFIGMIVVQGVLDNINNIMSSDDYKISINKCMSLSTMTAAAPVEYAGKTVNEIAVMLKGLSDIESSKTIASKIQPEEMRQSIRDQIKYLNKPKQASKSVQTVQAPTGNILKKPSVKTVAITSASAPKKDKIESESEKAGEWQFVFKAVYESFLEKPEFL